MREARNPGEDRLPIHGLRPSSCVLGSLRAASHGGAASARRDGAGAGGQREAPRGPVAGGAAGSRSDGAAPGPRRPRVRRPRRVRDMTAGTAHAPGTRFARALVAGPAKPARWILAQATAAGTAHATATSSARALVAGAALRAITLPAATTTRAAGTGHAPPTAAATAVAALVAGAARPAR